MASLSRTRFCAIIVFILYIFLGTIFPFCCGCFDDECRNIEFKEPVDNKAMKNHVISSEEVLNEGSCRLMCYMEPNCVAINLGPLVKGKHKCELNNATDENHLESRLSFTYLAIENLCSSSPCLNNGTCQAGFSSKGFRCICRAGFSGTNCHKAAKSCKELYDENKSRVSELVTLHFDSKPTTVLCHFGDFGCGDGGWTPVMKIDGNKKTFHYDSNFWSNGTGYNLPGGKSGFDAEETKLPSYWNTSFSKICLGMKIGQQINFIVINKQANSLYSLIADGQYRATSLGRNTWKKLIGSEASLQLNCNKEGFNAVSTWSSHSKARIGFLGNNENDCSSCNSRIGFGTGGYPDDSNTCGNKARYGGDNGDKHIKAMGYILLIVFDKICLGMKKGSQQINFIVINKQADSLYSLIADGQYCATSLGRNTWKTLIGSQAPLQSNA
ncbi:hypothetical protein ACROYT_G041322 [Oculina patagonica]